MSTVVALLMVPLVAFCAVSIDVANLWLLRQQLHNAADAAALAVAQDCARGSCGSPTSTAQGVAVLNVGAAVPQTSVTVSSGQVRVVASTTAHHVFAPIIGHESSRVTAGATVRWGSPTGGTAVLPLAFSWCEFNAQTNGGMPSGTTTRTIQFTKASGTQCTGPSNLVVPGGFGWLQPTSRCTSTASLGQTLYSSTGASVPNGCTTADFAALQNKTVLLPLFDTYGESGSNAWYHLYGYAAFTLTGYGFPGQYSWNASGCNGNKSCVKGYFTRFVDLSEAFQYGAGAPDLGASVLRLIA